MIDRHLTETEARLYLDTANGDELEAALTLAQDRESLCGGGTPDGPDIHHALYMIIRAIYPGRPSPSWDDTRVALRKRNFI